MIFSILSASGSSSSSGAQGGAAGTWIFVGILVIIMVAFMVYSRRSQKKRQDEVTNMLNAIKPGNKVKTIGGICGVVVEVCDDGTFVLETGTEASGKSFLKFDKQAVYQTDAVAEKKAPAKTEAPVETPVETVAEETTETTEATEEQAE